MARRHHSNRNRRRRSYSRRHSRRSSYHSGASLWNHSSTRSHAPKRRGGSRAKRSDGSGPFETANLIVDFATMPAEMRLAVIAGLLAVPGIVVSNLRGVLAGFTAGLPPGLDIVVSAIPEALFEAAPFILAVWGMIILELAKVAMWVGLACAAVLVVLGGIRVARRWAMMPRAPAADVAASGLRGGGAPQTAEGIEKPGPSELDVEW